MINVLFLGVSSSITMGATMPLFSILFGDVLSILAYEDSDKVRFNFLDISLVEVLFLGREGENLTLANITHLIIKIL